MVNFKKSKNSEPAPYSKAKAGAVIVKNRKVLIARIKGTDIFVMPSGTQKGNETFQETLKRELKEELNAGLLSIKPFGVFTAEDLFKGGSYTSNVFYVEVDGMLKPCTEMCEIRWINSSYKKEKIIIGSILEKFVIPRLIKENLID